MKIAVCVNGIYRDKINIHPDILDQKRREIFPTADFYYHTWESDVDRIPKKYQEKLFYCKEPKMTYHPVSDTNYPCKHGKFERYREKNIFHNKTQHGSKQILGYADLISKIPNDYDIIIRTRFDVEIANTDYSKYLEIAKNKGPVGFMIRPAKGHEINKVYDVPKDDPNADWYGYLPDQLIMHSPKHFDPNFVFDLHAQKNLLPVEWGWYQVMSEPYGYIHSSFWGICSIVR